MGSDVQIFGSTHISSCCLKCISLTFKSNPILLTVNVITEVCIEINV
jgi:hypothetical protein